MDYRVFLRLKLQDGKWITMGEKHIIPWDMRDLIAASSGWSVMNQESSGLASAIVPKLEKGILELTQSPNVYSQYEILHGLGAIQDALKFYQNLLQDCKEHPFTELYGDIVA